MQDTQYYPLQGGLDLITAAIATKPGRVIAGVNYEPVLRGYQRVDGFERLDGRTKPSEATYAVLGFDVGTATIAAGASVVGGTSGATGTALIDMAVTSGTLGGGDAAGYLVLIAVTGTFQDNELLKVGGVTKCQADGVALEGGALNDTDDATWSHGAIDAARALIQAVPGSGAVRGVWGYAGSIYAFRDNVGATVGVMFKATTSGWAAVDLGRSIAFTSGGTYEVQEGDTITGATSSATAVVRRAVLTSGDWAAGTAVGRLILSGQAGTLQAENLNVGANLNVATIAGNSTATTLPAGGRYEFLNHNFYGAASRRRMYGVNGVGTAFEYTGQALVPILTGMTIDAPDHIAVHKNQLFLSYPGGSLQNSSIGEPITWQVVTGANEIGLGSNVVGLIGEYVDSLAVFCRNKIAILYGNDRTDFQLSTLKAQAGAIGLTAQYCKSPIYMDDAGLRDLRAAQTFGDFQTGAVTIQAFPLIQAKRKAGITPVASLCVRNKDQYRLFWSDGTGITVYLGRKVPELLPFDIGFVPACASSSDDADENEILLFGDADGFVYQLDAGTSFDGDAVDAYLRLPFNHVGSPQYNKRWHKATLEIDAPANAMIGVTAEFSYGDTDLPQVGSQTFSVRGGGGFWNEANLNEFQWSAPVEGLADADIDGFGKNVSIAIASRATYERPHTIQGITLNYSMRSLSR